MATRIDRLQVIFEVAGDGNLKAAFSEIGKLADDVSKRTDKVATSQERMQIAAIRAAAVLGGGLVTAMGLVIKNTMEAEAVSAQLDARLKSTGGAAGMTRKAIDELAEATARKTTYDDDAIKSLSAMLLTFTKVHADVFPRATAAITDMATAMGTDLQSATIQVGKALNDPIEGVSALTRVGVQFSDAQQDVIKNLVETGQQAEAQRVILAELETQFGGAAEAARNTFGGALSALKNTLMDLTEGGDGSLEGATQAVNDFNDALNDPQTRAGVDALVSALFDLMGVAAQIPAAFSQMGKFIGITLAEMGNQANATWTILRNLQTFGMADGTIKGALQQSSAGREQYWKAMDDMVLANHGMSRDSYNASFQSQFNLGLPGSTTQVLGAGSTGGFNFAADQAARGGAIGGTPAKKPARSSGGGAPRAAAPRAMQDFGAEDLRDLQRLVEETARADAQFNKLAATLAGPLASAEYEHQQNLREIDQLGTQAGRSSEEVARLKEAETARYKEQRAEIEATLNPMQQLLDAYGLEIDAMGMGNAEKAMMNELRRQGIDLASAEAEASLAAARAIDQQARAAADALGYAEDAKGALHDFFLDMSRDARGTLQNIDDYFASFIDSVISRWLNSGLDRLFSGGGFGGFLGGGGGSGGGFWGSLAGLFGFGGGGSSASGGASFLDAFGGSYANGGIHGPQGPIPLNAYASGGIAKRPQLALFGEGRMPEAYVPLPDGRTIPVTMSGAGGGGDTYVIHNNIRGDVTRASADQLAGKLAMKLQRQARNR